MRNSDDTYAYHPAHNQERPNYNIKITPSRSNRRGLEQFIADPVWVKLSQDGVFRQKLLPSNVYYPYLRYTAQYYRKKCSVPIETQLWTVPALPVTATYVYTISPDDQEGVVLPLYVWQITSINPSVDFFSSWNNLRWLADPPIEGTQLEITYSPAATLESLLEYNLNKQYNPLRERPS
jgi:hypothetical protein